MKRTSNVLGALGLLLLGTACSGGAEEPAPFASATDLASRLAGDLGCPAYVERDALGAFIAVQGKSRVVVAPSENGMAEAARSWLAPYAADLGLPEGSLRVVAETRDAASMLRIVLSNGVPESIEAPGQDVEVTFDPEGRALGVVAHAPPAHADYTPKLSATEAVRIAKGVWAKDAAAGADPSANDLPEVEVTSKLTLTTFVGDEAPRLAHRVDAGPKSVWVDAATGEVLDSTDGLSPLKADMRGWKGYTTIPFPEGQKVKTVDYEPDAHGVALARRQEADNFFSKPKARIVVSSFQSLVRGTEMPIGTPIVAAGLAAMDVGYRSPAANRHPSMVDGLGVDAMLEAVRTESYFQTYLLGSPSRRLRVSSGIPLLVDDTIEIIVHTNYVKSSDLADATSTGRFREGAARVGGTTTIIIGDGNAALFPIDAKGAPTGPQDPTVNRSPALSTDAIAHEMTHMWLDSREVHGEADAIEEGIADVIGQFVEHEVAEAQGIPSRPDRVAEGVVLWTRVPKALGGGSLNHNGIRNLSEPDAVGAGASTTSTQVCLLPKVGGKLVRDARGLPKLDPKAVGNREGSHDCAHMNATIVGHAFYLMTLGGRNLLSKVAVRNPIGWNVSQKIWLSTIAKAITPTGYRPIVAFDYPTVARHQLAAAMFYSREVANAVGCAWEAVEVLPVGTTQKATGLACTKVAPIDCSRRKDGVYCDEVNDYSSVRCVNGSIGAPPAQCPSGNECRPQGGFVTNPATMDSKGNLRCFAKAE